MMMKDKAKKEAMLRMKERDAVAKKLRKEERDEYGDPVGGQKFLRKKKKRTLKRIHLMNSILLQLLKDMVVTELGLH